MRHHHLPVLFRARPLKVGSLLVALLLASTSAQADLYLCAKDGARRMIQDQPCAAGARVEARVREKTSSAPPAVSTASRKAGSSKASSIAVGVERNRGVICGLLDTEKQEALAQIAGQASTPDGEDPKTNLVKIEKQRGRVGCG